VPGGFLVGAQVEVEGVGVGDEVFGGFAGVDAFGESV
jgi:hypothetical protein